MTEISHRMRALAFTSSASAAALAASAGAFWASGAKLTP